MLNYLKSSDSLQYEQSTTYIGQLESTRNIMGLWAWPDPTVTSPDTLYALVDFLNGEQPGGITAAMFAWDAVTGAAIIRVSYAPFWSNGSYMMQSRSGKLWYVEAAPDSRLQSFTMSNISTANQEFIPAASYGLTTFGIVVYDEAAQVLVNITGPTVTVLGVGGVVKSVCYFPDTVLAACLYVNNQMMALCANGALVTYDYTTNMVLTSQKIRSRRTEGTLSLDTNSIHIYWYPRYSQLLVLEHIDDWPAGGSPTCITYYSLLRTATHLTAPIPLDAPIYGDNVPVAVQLVDDLNQAVSGFAVRETVTDQGELLGSPSPDAYGRALSRVGCESTGDFAINCTTVVPDITIAPPVSLTVQTNLTFAVSDHVVGDAPFALSAASNNPAPINYSVISGNVTLNGNQLTIIGAGPVTIQASQPSYAQFSGPTTAIAQFNIADSQGGGYTGSQGQWGIIPLTKGFLYIAMGSAQPNGQAVSLPSGGDASRFIWWASASEVFHSGDIIFHGVSESQFSGLTPTSLMEDGQGHTDGQSTNYAYVTWSIDAQVSVTATPTSATLTCKTLAGDDLAIMVAQLQDGDSVTAASGFDSSRFIGLIGMCGFIEDGNQNVGIATCAFNQSGSANPTVSARYLNGNNQSVTQGKVNVMCFYTKAGQGTIYSQDGGTKLEIPTYAGGHAVCLYAITLQSGATAPSPDGYSFNSSTCAMNGTNSGWSGNRGHGILNCTMNNTAQFMGTYADGSGHQWTGSGYTAQIYSK